MCSKSSARYIWLGIYNYFLYVDIKTLSEMFFGGFYGIFSCQISIFIMVCRKVYRLSKTIIINMFKFKVSLKYLFIKEKVY